LVIDSLLPTGRKIQQVIITNNSAGTVYLKIWNRAFGAKPTISSVTWPDGSSSNGWNYGPDMILPCAANETADYTFLGEDHIVWTTGIIINVGQSAGTEAVSAATVSAEVIIFANT